MIGKKVQQSEYVKGKEIYDSDMSKNWGLNSQDVTNPTGLVSHSSQEVNF